jgi:hypothetical protein
MLVVAQQVKKFLAFMEPKVSVLLEMIMLTICGVFCTYPAYKEESILNI